MNNNIDIRPYNFYYLFLLAMNTINDYSFKNPIFKNWKIIGEKVCRLSLTEGSLVEKRILKRFKNFEELWATPEDKNPVRDWLKNWKYMTWDIEQKEWIGIHKDFDDYYEEQPKWFEDNKKKKAK